MKFQFDLLPQEYKCLPRDNLGIILGTFAMVICLTATASLWKKNDAQIQECKAQIKQSEEQIDAVYREMNQFQTPSDRIVLLKNTIDFINKNLETPGSSWVDFLFVFEGTVPAKVFVRDINPKDFSGVVRDFTVEGEAATIYDILDFISRLQKSGRFENVYLKQDAINLAKGEGAIRFTLAFSFKKK